MNPVFVDNENISNCRNEKFSYTTADRLTLSWFTYLFSFSVLHKYTWIFMMVYVSDYFFGMFHLHKSA